MLSGLVAISAIFGVVNAIASDNVTITEGGWDYARATFYGPSDGRDGMGAACGYGNVFDLGYGQETTALSTALFNDGAACGACFEIYCSNAPQGACKRGSIRVTATNFCPPNYSQTQGAWCNPPQKHFDLSMPMFLKIAEYKAGVVPVMYRRVKCWKQGGVKFVMGGNNYWTTVLVYNVGGVGDVKSVRVRGSGSDWTWMSRNWGQNWQVSMGLLGKSVSFEVTISDGSYIQHIDVVPSSWGFGMTFEGKYNFH
ncbi:expansin-A23-like [Salvia divinorum]